METLNFEIIEGVAKITLQRPKAFNSINKALATHLQKALDQCAEDANVRAVVLTGSGKAFCAGQDLVEVTTPELMPGFKALLEEHYQPIILKIRDLEKPVIAAVNGVAAGAGANIALACDIVVACESARFIQAFSGIGLVPDSGGTFFLPRLVGFQKAVALAMLGDKIPAQEAEKMGMIYRVFSNDAFMAEVDQLAQRLAKMPTKGLALTKKVFSASLTNTLEAQLAVENKAQIAASKTEDYQEGVQAFIEKRAPIFKGQ